MKKLIFTLLTCCLIYTQSNAQYCGNSGPAICNPANDTLTAPGLAPLSDSLTPLYIGETVSTTIQFQNYDTTRFGGTLVTIDSLQIDTILNLPGGLCWATNKANNRFSNKEKGCIVVSGVVDSTDLCGQYQLYIIVGVWAGGLQIPSLNASTESLYYYVRVKCSQSDTCLRSVDTTGEYIYPTTIAFEQYSPTTCGFLTGIQDISNISYLNALNIVPNPISNEATVSFISAKTGKVTERITNMLGSTVYSNELQLETGLNTHTINKGNLAAGVYIYSLTDGQSSYSKKLVISE